MIPNDHINVNGSAIVRGYPPLDDDVVQMYKRVGLKLLPMTHHKRIADEFKDGNNFKPYPGELLTSTKGATFTNFSTSSPNLDKVGTPELLNLSQTLLTFPAPKQV